MYKCTYVLSCICVYIGVYIYIYIYTYICIYKCVQIHVYVYRLYIERDIHTSVMGLRGATCPGEPPRQCTGIEVHHSLCIFTPRLWALDTMSFHENQCWRGHLEDGPSRAPYNHSMGPMRSGFSRSTGRMDHGLDQSEVDQGCYKVGLGLSSGRSVVTRRMFPESLLEGIS